MKSPVIITLLFLLICFAGSEVVESTADFIPNPKETLGDNGPRTSDSPDPGSWTSVVTGYAGNTFDRCRTSSQCNGSRKCQTLSRSDCPIVGGTCFCFPTSFQFCISSSQCPKGEVCADNKRFLRQICTSPDSLKYTLFGKAGTAPRPPGDRLPLSPCANDGQCRGRCLFLYGTPFAQACGGRDPCFCIENLDVCFSSEDCDSGEVCSNTPISRRATCVSAIADRNLVSLREITSTVANTGGYAFDPCRQNSDCTGGRLCYFFGIRLAPCNGESPCACISRPVATCNSSDDCVQKEVCARTRYSTSNLCVSLDARREYDDMVTVTTPIVCPVLISNDPPMRQLVLEALERVGTSAPKDRDFAEGAPEREAMQKSVMQSGPELAKESHIDLPFAATIVGGRLVSSNLVPYMVFLARPTGSLACSGTLISKGWVLTAAHCRIQAGYFAGVMSPRASSTSKTIRIKRVFTHPDYNAERFLNDVAVCELEEDAPAGSKFMSLNGLFARPGDNEPVRAIGYGRIRFQMPADFYLRQVDVRSVSNANCTRVYEEESFRGVKVEEKAQLCGGILPRGGCGICQGDSGGPVVQYVDGKPVILGLSSFGVRCGDWKFPGVYARVSSYVAWLESTPAVFNVEGGGCKKGERRVSGKCEECGKRFVSEGGNATACKRCKDKLYRDDMDGSQCVCSGKFAVGRGLQGGKCLSCKPGFFAGLTDSVCRRCSKGTTSGRGAESCS